MFGEIIDDLFGSGSGEPDYQCKNCGTAFERRRQLCPVCEGFTIDRREW